MSYKHLQPIFAPQFSPRLQFSRLRGERMDHGAFAGPSTVDWVEMMTYNEECKEEMKKAHEELERMKTLLMQEQFARQQVSCGSSGKGGLCVAKDWECCQEGECRDFGVMKGHKSIAVSSVCV